MSIYSCYLVTQAAMRQFGLSKIPDEWFNWRYVSAPTGAGQSATLCRIKIVESSQSPRVQTWYTQVTHAGLASTLIHTTDERAANFPFTATDAWGGGAKLFAGMIIPGDETEIAGWTHHLSQPDELAVLEWLDHQLGGGGDCNRYFNRVKNFAHCYANELKRWIAIGSNAELLAEQWDDVRGWPEDSPSLTVDDFAWDRGFWSASQFAVPMRRLPFCEIGFDKLASRSSTNGLLPDDRPSGHWLFDRNGEVEAELKRLAYAEDMEPPRTIEAEPTRAAAADVSQHGWDWTAAPNVPLEALMASSKQARSGAQAMLMDAAPVAANESTTLELRTYFNNKTLFPNNANTAGPEWDGASLTISWRSDGHSQVQFKARGVPDGWVLQVMLSQSETPAVLTSANRYWNQMTVAPNTQLNELKVSISARHVPAPG